MYSSYSLTFAIVSRSSSQIMNVGSGQDEEPKCCMIR
jgi:hypothetical protein